MDESATSSAFTSPPADEPPPEYDPALDEIIAVIVETQGTIDEVDGLLMSDARSAMAPAVSSVQDSDAVLRGDVYTLLDAASAAVAKADATLVRDVATRLNTADDLISPAYVLAERAANVAAGKVVAQPGIQPLVIDVDTIPAPNPFPGPVPVPQPQPQPDPTCKPSCTVTDQSGTHCVGIPNTTDLECCGQRFPTQPDDPCCFDNFLSGEVVCPPGVEPPPDDTLPGGTDCEPCPAPKICPPVQECEPCPTPEGSERCLADPWCLPAAGEIRPNKVYDWLRSTQQPINATLGQ